MSTANATPAAMNAAPWPGSSMVGFSPTVKSQKTIAASVPETSPVQPAVGLIRRQNMPRRNVAKSGALKNPKRVCR